MDWKCLVCQNEIKHAWQVPSSPVTRISKEVSLKRGKIIRDTECARCFQGVTLEKACVLVFGDSVFTLIPSSLPPSLSLSYSLFYALSSLHGLSVSSALYNPFSFIVPRNCRFVRGAHIASRLSAPFRSLRSVCVSWNENDFSCTGEER